ncbi:hypothetical protein CLV63_11235 [Murinocardiopsis flavida]|uniref:Uncharacterized protein n=1 Tax=Murinocardiopsis flavida TaxID=645275 RepID=A0A2P8DG17_9ACTN|nr:hypothetical protein [Murinocardiopsis flavida]PSK96153.1 hypothetical protein CLV63_11235 [Murinocardiopsis flavida]
MLFSPYCRRLLTQELGENAVLPVMVPVDHPDHGLESALYESALAITWVEERMARLAHDWARNAEDITTALAEGRVPTIGDHTDELRRCAERFQTQRGYFCTLLRLTKAARTRTTT